jgi:hypothetical protein
MRQARIEALTPDSPLASGAAHISALVTIDFAIGRRRHGAAEDRIGFDP